MRAHRLSPLPIPESGCGDTRVTTDGYYFTLEYEYRSDNEDWIGGISFASLTAYRFRSEMYSRGYASDSFGAVAEIIDSPWKNELNAIAATGISDVQSARHFVIFLTSNGYFEVLAATFELLLPRRGLLGR